MESSDATEENAPFHFRVVSERLQLIQWDREIYMH